SGSHLVSTWIPNTHGVAFLQDSAHAALRSLTSVDQPAQTFMLAATGGSNGTRILPRLAANSDPSFVINGGSFTTPNVNLSGEGMFVAVRPDASNQNLYRNGVLAGNGAVVSIGRGTGVVSLFRSFTFYAAGE